MLNLLVLHGAGMDLRGLVQIETFGPMKLPEYDERIRAYAQGLGVSVETFHSNLEAEVIDRLHAAQDQGVDGIIFNPAGFGTGYPALVAALAQVACPLIEVHISNPLRRGPATQTAAVSRAVVAGFGVEGFDLALRGLCALLAAREERS